MSNQKVVLDITTSLDGFIAGPNDGPDNGLGDGGERLHEWLFDLEGWREPHGLSGGKKNRDSEIMEEFFERTGAMIVGKRMFDNAGGWGDEPPFHKPVFVLTHETRETEAKEGGTTFIFVNDGVESALEQARAAAEDKDVGIGGGANTAQQFMKAGLLNEMQIHVSPLLLGGGIRLFDQIGPDDLKLEITKVVESPRVTHLSYRILK
jgi:dihydrofolate reductase